MTTQLITALILGLVGGLVPGPVLAATFTEILQSGLLKSLRIVLWAMLTETIVALVSLVLLSSFGLPLSFFNILSIVGAGVLVWIAIQIWNIRTLDTDQRVQFSSGKIASMIVANGVLWTFWVTVCVPKAIALDAVVPYGKFTFLAAVEVGWLCVDRCSGGYILLV